MAINLKKHVFSKSVKKFTESFSLFSKISPVREIRGHIKLWPAILRCVKNQPFDFFVKMVKNGKNRQKCEKCDHFFLTSEITTMLPIFLATFQF